MSKWIKKGDKVVVTAGNERGKISTVLSRQKDRVRLQGLNIRKKHVKRKTRAPTPEMVEMEMPMHISNVRLCNDEGKPIKVKSRTSAKGAKELFYTEGTKEITLRQIRTS